MNFLIKIIVLFILPLHAFAELNTTNYHIKTQNFNITQPYNSFSKKGQVEIFPCNDCVPAIYNLSDKTLLFYFGKQSNIDKINQFSAVKNNINLIISANKKKREIIYIEWGPMEVGGVE